MALILVVEPDRTRAAQVASLMRNHLRAQTIVVDCAVRARGALVYSIPDVILLSTLISTRDEAGITSELRGLGDAAAHVQVLTIPMLADAPAPPASRRGVLASFLAAKPSIETSGCEADLFAQQVADYLDLAASTRKAVPEQPEQTEQPLELILVPPSDFLLLPAEDDFLPEPVADTSDMLRFDFDAPEDDTSLAAAEDDTCFATAEDDTCLVAAEDDTAFVASEDDTVLVASEDDTALVASEDDTCLAASEDDTCVVAPEDVPCLVVPEAADYASVVIAPEVIAYSYDEAADHVGNFNAPADVAYFSAPEDGDRAVDTTEDDGWISISLESPVEQETDDASAAVAVAPAAKSRKKDRKREPEPAVQDEWGLFNPDQCGFPALLARLNELEKRGESDSEDAVTTVRVGGGY